MCHNAPWLSALDKQIRLQFVPKKSKADVVSEFWRQSISYSVSSSRETSVAETVIRPCEIYGCEGKRKEDSAGHAWHDRVLLVLFNVNNDLA